MDLFSKLVELDKTITQSGFSWPTKELALDKCQEELNEVKVALLNESYENQVEEIGDLLLSIVTLASQCSIDINQSLSISLDKYETRYLRLCKALSEQGESVSSCNIETLITTWKGIK